MYTSIIVFLIFLSVLTYLYLTEDKRNKAEQKRFREFVIAVKSRDLDQYTNAIPEENEEPPQQPVDDIVGIDQVDPEQLRKALNEDK